MLFGEGSNILRDLTDSMAFVNAPKAFQSLKNAYRKRSVSLFSKSLEFYASSVELSEDGKNGKLSFLNNTILYFFSTVLIYACEISLLCVIFFKVLL